MYAVPGERRRLLERRRRVEQPRHRGGAREREAGRVAAAHGRDADEGERPALPVHRLQVDARLGHRYLELEDQLVGLERGQRAIVVAREAVQIVHRELASIGADAGSEGEQCGRRIGGMRGCAPLVAEEGVLAVLSLPGVAAIAAVQVARESQPPVPTARGLQQIAADRPRSPQLGRGREPAGFAQRRRDLRIGLELGEGRAGADGEGV